MFRRSRLNLRGRWVLVTGASAGLGAAIARDLAMRYGANLLLVARRKPVLDAFAADLEKAFPVRAVAIQADLSKPADIDRVIAEVASYAPVAAVLNAGITHNVYFSGKTLHQARDIIATNIAGTTAMLAGVTDLFTLSLERRGILVISSIAGQVSLPHQAVYAASKAYITKLVQSVAHELAETQVSLGAFLPGGIDTDMARSSELSSFSRRLGLMQTDRCAHLAVDALVSGRLISVPGLANKAANLASRLLPRGLMAKFAAMPYRLPPRLSHRAILETPRLVLRPRKDADNALLHEHVFADADVMRYAFEGKPLSRADTEHFLREHFTSGETRTGIAVLTENPGGNVIGFAGLFPCKLLGADDYEIGFVMAREAWGRGYATEIGEAQLAMGFEELKCERLLGLVHPDNAASIHALEKLGMRYLLKDVASPDRPLRRVYAISAAEWQKRRTKKGGQENK